MDNEQQGPEGQQDQPVQIDEIRLNQYLQTIRDNQNLTMGIAVGAVAAVVGAIIWAIITNVTGYQIGWMAVGVGFLVGYAVKFAGKGMDISFGIAGAVLALMGCLLGNLFTLCVAIGLQENIAATEILWQLDLDSTIEIMVATFDPMDLLFYGIAVYEGYRFSIVQITDEEMSQFIK